MLNGCMRTNKIVKLHELIDLLNNRFPSLNIIKKDKDVRDINSNPWLSGFIDSDGCFLIYISQNSKNCRFELSQKHVTHTGLSQLEIMSSLAKFCKVNLISMNKKNSDGLSQLYKYCVNTAAAQSNIALISYLDVFPGNMPL